MEGERFKSSRIRSCKSVYTQEILNAKQMKSVVEERSLEVVLSFLHFMPMTKYSQAL